MKKFLIMCVLFASAISSKAQWSHVGPIQDNSSSNWFETGRLDCITPDFGFNGTTNQTVYAGSGAGGLWVSTNLCGTWTNVVIPDAVTFHGVQALHAVTSSYMLAATFSSRKNFGNVYQYYPSTNTWTASNFSTVAGPTCTQVRHIRSLPNNPSIVLAATNNGMYRSTNGGLNWTNVQAGDFENVDFVPVNTITGGYKVFVCGGSNVIMYSNDQGVTYAAHTNMTSLFSGSAYHDLSVTFNSANTNERYVYFVAQIGSSHYTGRLTINQTTGAETPVYYSGSAFSDGSAINADRTCVAADDQVVYFGSGGLGKYNVFNNTRYVPSGGIDAPGSSVSYNVPGHADNHDMVILPAINKMIYVNDGGCYVNSYTNLANQVYNNSWVYANDNLNISQIFGLSCAEEDENEYITGEQDTKVFRTNALTTTFGFGGTEPTNVLIDKYDKNNFFHSTYMANSNVVGSYNGNGFNSNQPQTSTGGPCINLSNFWAFPGPEFGSNTLFQDPNHQDKIFFGTKGSALSEFCISQGKFVVKKTFTSVGTFQQYINGLAFSRADANKVYAILSSRNYPGDQHEPQVFVYSGTDFSNSYPGSNDSWTLITPSYTASPFTVPVTYPTSAAIEFADVAVSDWDPDLIWVATRTVPGNPGMKVIKRQGGTWTDYSNGIPSTEMVLSMIYEQGTNDLLYVGTETNVYYRDATMSAWAIYSTSLPNIAINQLRINYKENTLRAGTYGHGMWKSALKCPANGPLSVTGTISTNNFYEAVLAVNVSNHTVNGGDVKYRSTTMVEFLPDVLITASASPNTTAFAYIHGCSAGGNTFRQQAQAGSQEMITVEELKKKYEEQLMIYPNPTDGRFTINIAGEESYNISVYNMLGAEVLKFSNISVNNLEIDLSEFKSGIYTIRCWNVNGMKTEKVIVQ